MERCYTNILIHEATSKLLHSHYQHLYKFKFATAETIFNFNLLEVILRITNVVEVTINKPPKLYLNNRNHVSVHGGTAW